MKSNDSMPLLFTVIRKADESGVSGIGRVLDGVLWHNGKVTVCWRTDVDASMHGHSSIGIYDSWNAFAHIHINSHPTNGTVVAFFPAVALGQGV